MSLGDDLENKPTPFSPRVFFTMETGASSPKFLTQHAQATSGRNQQVCHDLYSSVFCLVFCLFMVTSPVFVFFGTGLISRK